VTSVPFWGSWDGLHYRKRKKILQLMKMCTKCSTCSHLDLYIFVQLYLLPKTEKKERWLSIFFRAFKEMTKLLTCNTFQPHTRYQNKYITVLLGNINGFYETNWQQVYPDLFLIKILLWNVFLNNQMQLVTKVQITDITKMQPRFQQASWRHFWTKIRLCCKHEILEHY